MDVRLSITSLLLLVLALPCDAFRLSSIPGTPNRTGGNASRSRRSFSHPCLTQPLEPGPITGSASSLARVASTCRDAKDTTLGALPFLRLQGTSPVGLSSIAKPRRDPATIGNALKSPQSPTNGGNGPGIDAKRSDSLPALQGL